jgi:hypothetical protein
MEFEQCHCKQARRKEKEKLRREEERNARRERERERAREERSSGACTNKCVVNFVLCLPAVE